MDINILTFQKVHNFLKNEKRLEVNETEYILIDIDLINRGQTAWFGNNKERHRAELLERAKNNDGVISEREQELIDKAMDGKLTPAERAELINLLPAKGNTGISEANRARGKSNAELIEEMRDFSVTANGFQNAGDAFARDELLRRASADGKMSAELNALFDKLRNGKDLTAEEFERFRQLLLEEDNIV